MMARTIGNGHIDLLLLGQGSHCDVRVPYRCLEYLLLSYGQIEYWLCYLDAYFPIGSCVFSLAERRLCGFIPA